MTIVVGVAPDESGTAALTLASMLARASDDDLVVTSMVPQPWPPRPEALDSDYRRLLTHLGEQALARARAQLDPRLHAQFVLREVRSVPAGLVEIAAEHDTSMLVLGSSSAGAYGQVSFGSVLDRLLHGAGLPIAIAPRGYRSSETVALSRVTVAFGGDSTDAQDLLLATSAVTSRVRARLRVASFFVRPTTPFGGTMDATGEDFLVERWASDARARIDEALQEVAAAPDAPPVLDTVVGDGFTWAAALDDVPWAEGDLLVVGSSNSGPLAQVFLGSRASKIVRHSPVPVVVVPRAAARRRAHELSSASQQASGGTPAHP